MTIHNVNDTGFHSDQSLLSNGVEITRITGSTHDNYNINPNLAVGSHRQPVKSHEQVTAPPEFGG